MAQNAWRCSQCGAINEPGSRACHACGKWPSLFDLQDNVVEDAQPQAAAQPTVEVGEFEPQTFEPVTFDPQTYEAEGVEETAEPKRRTPRWLGTAVWVVIIAVWLIVNALADNT